MSDPKPTTTLRIPTWNEVALSSAWHVGLRDIPLWFARYVLWNETCFGFGTRREVETQLTDFWTLLSPLGLPVSDALDPTPPTNADGTVRLPDAIEAWLDGHFGGDKGDDARELEMGRNIVAVAFWSLMYLQGDPDDDRATLDALTGGAASALIEARSERDELLDEIQRHRSVALVRAVMEGCEALDIATDDDFDRIPWTVAEKALAECDAARTERDEAIDTLAATRAAVVAAWDADDEDDCMTETSTVVERLRAALSPKEPPDRWVGD